MVSVVLCTTVFFVVVGFAGLTQAVPPRPRRRATTTTTFPTTFSQVQGWSSGLVGSECTCCARDACVDHLQTTYFPLLQASDFATLTDRLNTLCDNDIPAAKSCLWRTQRRECEYIDLTIIVFQRFCFVRQDMEAGMLCWSGGFQGMMDKCVVQLHPGRREPCEGITDLKACVRASMADLPLCLPQDVRLVMDYVRNNTISICPDQ